MIEEYFYAERDSKRDEILGMLKGAKTLVLEHKETGDRILSNILSFVKKLYKLNNEIDKFKK